MNHKKTAALFILTGLITMVLGLVFGVVGGFQYILPDFLKEQLTFQTTRPLHVYLVISFIFSSAVGCVYYFLPEVAARKLYSPWLAFMHWLCHSAIIVVVVTGFFCGHFSGREYLEFPPVMALVILGSWSLLIVNFFKTMPISFHRRPVYVWSWATGIIFFFITVTEAHLWVLPYFHNNIIRDLTVQWKALGSMVGSWNMLVYGTTFYVMERITNDKTIAQSKTAFFFYFLSLTNLMFNWGHHTYIVPASPVVKEVSYIISMTELLFIGKIIYTWRQTYIAARLNYSLIPYRLFTAGDFWVFLNLILAIIISVPAVNLYTHGTHITVAHAMGTTIGINTNLLLGCVLFVAFDRSPEFANRYKKYFMVGIPLLNMSLLVFWAALLICGVIKSSDTLNSVPFATMMTHLQPWFVMFTGAGVCIMISLFLILFPLIRIFLKKSD
jgi:nitric oxide reductase subunit B